MALIDLTPDTSSFIAKEKKILIGGQWSDPSSDARVNVVNPSDGGVLGAFGDASAQDVDRAVAAARKGEHDIAIGNVIGSNLFNLLGVMALPGVIAPGAIDMAIVDRDYPLMLMLTAGFYLVAFGPRRAPEIRRYEGGLLLSVYLAYLAYLLVDTGAISF